MVDEEKHLDELCSDNGSAEDLDKMMYTSDHRGTDMTDPNMRAMQEGSDKALIESYPPILKAWGETRKFCMDYLTGLGLDTPEVKQVFWHVKQMLKLGKDIKSGSRNRLFKRDDVVKVIRSAYAKVITKRGF